MSAQAEGTIQKYQQDCFRSYLNSIADCVPGGLPCHYTYPDGNPIRPLPPAQTFCGGLMIIGAYPSARFEYRMGTKKVNGHTRWRLVPVADNLHPFADETYFDGLGLRVLESGKGLREYLLGPLSLSPEKCWITDLVKVFLYKPDHEGSCGDACPKFKVSQMRSRFTVLGRASLSWLEKEVDICQPKLAVTLGEEVAQVVSGDARARADDLLNRELQHPDALGGFPTLYLPHPDACRRSEKWRKQLAGRIPMIEKILKDRTAE